MSLRDDVNNSYEKNSEEEKDEKDKRNITEIKVSTISIPSTFEPPEIDYSYDCDNCAFRNFMATLGFKLDISTCWMDCTVENYDEITNVFGFILDHTMKNQQSAILYTGLIPDEYKKNSRRVS